MTPEVTAADRARARRILVDGHICHDPDNCSEDADVVEMLATALATVRVDVKERADQVSQDTICGQRDWIDALQARVTALEAAYQASLGLIQQARLVAQLLRDADPALAPGAGETHG